MAPPSEDLFDEEPPSINPYEVLGIEKTATADEVKSAYRKSALKNHPDKAPEHLKATAHTNFQSIAFAYAVLSDPIRRKRYDATGSTSESIVDSDGFSWTDFYREQYADIVSSEAIEKFAKKYKGSDEEMDDILIAYKKFKGDMDKIYASIMLSDPVDDDFRFRDIIDAAIGRGDVEGYRAYTEESEATKQRRIRDVNKEAEEAMAYAEELGVADKIFGKSAKGKSKTSTEESLMALIQSRQQDRGRSFLDNLEAKYAPKAPKAKAKKGKKRASVDERDEPTEEAFQGAAARLKKANGVTEVVDTSSGRRSKRTKH